jgi:starch synthase/alpha-amylase
LIVSPEIAYLPSQAGVVARYYRAKAGGMADVVAGLMSSLLDQGVDVHLAIPYYRPLLRSRLPQFLQTSMVDLLEAMADNRIHLVDHHRFTHLESVYSSDGLENTRLSLAFQRGVIDAILPRVRPDLIHCHDWMTGLLPAWARTASIPSLFTLHNIHTVKSTLRFIEDHGIDPRRFWDWLYYHRMPAGYEESRDVNPVEYMTSGILAADRINTVSETFLKEIIDGRHGFVEPTIREELGHKRRQGRAVGILNAPDKEFDPTTDACLFRSYGPEDHAEGKKENKRMLQLALGLQPEPAAPLFYWPSRLDSLQKGSQLLSHLLVDLVNGVPHPSPQVLFVADGDQQPHFKDLVRENRLGDRVAVCDFDEHLSHLAYGAADFVLMPSRFEPCGLPQMIGSIYGALPVVHRTGGLCDTVAQMDPENDAGNGFHFGRHDPGGLWEAVQDALAFFRLPDEVRRPQVARVMKESVARFSWETVVEGYLGLYEGALGRPVRAPNHPLPGPPPSRG